MYTSYRVYFPMPYLVPIKRNAGGAALLNARRSGPGSLYVFSPKCKNTARAVYSPNTQAPSIRKPQRGNSAPRLVRAARGAPSFWSPTVRGRPPPRRAR